MESSQSAKSVNLWPAPAQGGLEGAKGKISVKERETGIGKYREFSSLSGLLWDYHTGVRYSPFTAADEKIPLSVVLVNKKPQYLVFCLLLAHPLSKQRQLPVESAKAASGARVQAAQSASNPVQPSWSTAASLSNPSLVLDGTGDKRRKRCGLGANLCRCGQTGLRRVKDPEQPVYSVSAMDSVIFLVIVKGTMSKHRSQFAALIFAFLLLPAVNPAQTPVPVNGIDPALLARAKSGDAAAQFLVATAYRKGQGVPKDQALSASWLRQSAEQGLPNAQYDLGLCFELGQGVPKDNAQAAIWYQKAALQGNSDAMRALALLYVDGQGVPKDARHAFVLFSQAAALGDAYSQYQLGMDFSEGKDVLKDEKQAAVWFRKAAEQGSADAQYRLGVCYSNGKGVQQDDEKAAVWYQLAANQNHAEALLDLGLLYKNGRGVPQDAKKALELFRQSAEFGESDAQYRVGLAYDMGEEVKKDQKEAIKWYRKSAEQGFAGAQFNLAMRLSNQPAEMYFWLSLAAPQLNGEPLAMAIKIQDLAAGLLKPVERAEIDERVKQWQEAHQKKP